MPITPKNQNPEHGSRSAQAPKYDLWLDKHRGILDQSKDAPILDLGCGQGNDSLYLTERGYQVICCDKSETSISKVRFSVPSAAAMVLDMMNGLPFGDQSFSVIIADLCLHYFRWEDTVDIVREISRVLKDDGFLLCRVNSINDFNYGAGQGDLLEDNYYAVQGKTKRFFNVEQIESLFNTWKIHYIRECQLDRYEYPKILWEIALQK